MGVGALSLAFGNTLQRVVGSIVSPLVKQGGGGLGALIPGANRFRIYTVTGTYPVIKTTNYSLEVSGLVGHPMLLSFLDLQALPRAELVRDFQCVTGWRVPNVEWAGVRLGDILDLAKPTQDATGVEFTSYDGTYTESLTIEEARRSDVLVAYEMLGNAITAEHGGPVRLYVARCTATSPPSG
jgi:DMSO/TMAO reductase YedYZ molybdopterin-dependent catalytic subunit